jgi:hypothetical protein
MLPFGLWLRASGCHMGVTRVRVWNFDGLFGGDLVEAIVAA